MLTHEATPSPAKIRVIKIAPVEKGALRAFADVALGESLVIKGFRIIQQSGQRPWTSPPQREYLDKDGNKKYSPIVDVTGDLKNKIQDAILSAWEGESHA